MLDGKGGKVKLYMTRRGLSNQAFPQVARPRCGAWKNLKEHRLYRLIQRKSKIETTLRLNV